ncbi:MAG TPA: hypothetical protein VHE35_00370 [Kofleriaceae bacterium]|nr:hypothetical protein [Kofleriaceae bacterium]
MKPASLAVLGSLLLLPAIAIAQPLSGGVPAYGPPPGYPPPGAYPVQPGPPLAPGGYHDRAGRLSLGFSLGLGQLKINDASVACDGCDYDPIAGSGDAHIAYMMSHRLALGFEVQLTDQTIATDPSGSFTDSLVQSGELFTAQYWLTPQLWIKGGIGPAQLTATHEDAFTSTSSDSLDGGAIMGAVGYEVLSARDFAIDLQLRGSGGSFKDGTDNGDGTFSDSTFGTTSLQVGFNWF